MMPVVLISSIIESIAEIFFWFSDRQNLLDELKLFFLLLLVHKALAARENRIK
jgi:hypothetical protein